MCGGGEGSNEFRCWVCDKYYYISVLAHLPINDHRIICKECYEKETSGRRLSE